MMPPASTDSRAAGQAVTPSGPENYPPPAQIDVGAGTGLSISGNLAFSVDEIKVGSAYADVVPETSTNVAIGAVALLGAGQWVRSQRRRRESESVA